MIKRYIEYRRSKDTRPDWEKMSDDGMNKFLKFCITVVFFYMGLQVIDALIRRFM
tara:strand:+ start:298 stop:462 length:165 start_codon:yes stop_codon:yes gene_type:complete